MKYLGIIGTLFLAILLRVWSVYPYNTTIGFDQARDLWDATTIFRDHNLRIIGPTAGNNPSLHHGILYIYYLIPPLLIFRGNPMAAVYWNIFFNAATCMTLYFFGKSLFGKTKPALLSALIFAISYQAINFAGWLSNPTVTLFTVPLFYWGLWEILQNRSRGWLLTCFAFGLSIQFELFFIYLIPIGIFVWLIWSRKFPSIKIIILSFGLLVLTLSTMILTELKFGFAGIKSLLHAGSMVDGVQSNFWPRFLLAWEWNVGKVVGLTLLVGFIVAITKFRKKNLVFLFIYLLSPATMLLLGSHNAPWFLIALPPAIALASGYVLSKIKYVWIVVILIIFMQSHSTGQPLLEPDQSALLDSQLKAIDYTYQTSKGSMFTINSVTNPLYINAVWAYNYYWYGQRKYGYLPTWSGGDQLYPYNVLPKTNNLEKYIYLVIDKNSRIPSVYRQKAQKWLSEYNKPIHEKTFGDILVQKITK